MIPAYVRHGTALLRRQAAQVILFLLLILHFVLFVSMRNSTPQPSCSDSVQSIQTDETANRKDFPEEIRDISGLSLVELYVRPSAFSDLDASRTYDLYFSGTARSGAIQSENVYDWVLIDSYESKTSILRIYAPRADVPVLLTLERLGEFRLVAAAEHENELRPQNQDPLSQRQWVQSLLGTDELETLQ